MWHCNLPEGNGPTALRRQCWCVVGTQAVLFGGTCTTPRVTIKQGDVDVVENVGLKDLSDCFVLDFDLL